MMDNLSKMLDDAYELFNQKEFEASMEVLRDAEAQFGDTTKNNPVPKDKYSDYRASIENFKGFNFMGLGNIETAEKCFENALSINPNSSQACAGLAEVFYLRGMDYESKIMFEWAIENNTLNQFAVSGLKKVNLSLNLSEDHNTLNSESALLEINTNQFFEELKEAYRLFSEKFYEESLVRLESAEKVLRVRKEDSNHSTRIASLENLRAYNLLALNRIGEAQSTFEKVLNINPSSSQACAGLGEIFYLNGNYSESKTMFEWAIVNNGRNNFAISRLEKLNVQLGYAANDNSLVQVDDYAEMEEKTTVA